MCRAQPSPFPNITDSLLSLLTANTVMTLSFRQLSASNPKIMLTGYHYVPMSICGHRLLLNSRCLYYQIHYNILSCLVLFSASATGLLSEC